MNAFGNYTLSSLQPGESQAFHYRAQKDGVVSLGFDGSKYILRVYKDDNGVLDELDGLSNAKELSVDKDHTYYIQFTNNTGNVLSSVSWSFNRVQELFYNEVSEYFDVLKKRTFIFNAPVDGNYEITELASGLTHSTDVPRINNTYYLSAGEHYIVIEGDLHASLRTKCCVRLATQKIYVNGGQGNGFAGNAKSIFIEFTPKLTANYKFNLPTGIVQFSELIKDKPEDEPLFVGCKVYNSTVNDVLRRRCKLAGISTISVHGLRHTHASLLLFAGVSIASVARRLGHASINTTQKTYLHTQWCTLEKCNVKN